MKTKKELQQPPTIPTVGWSDVSLQRPTSTNTTIADHDRRRQKWPPSAPHEALRSAPAHCIDRRQPPEQADMIFGAVKDVYGPQNTPMMWRFIIAGIKERFKGHTHAQPPPKVTSTSLGGCNLFIQSIGAECKASCGALRGHFRRQWPWLWRLWCQLCFVIRLLKISIKALKLIIWSQFLYVLLCIVKHVIIHISLIVAWTEPELYGGRSPNRFGPMNHGILGIAGKLLSLWEQFSHCNEAKM